MHLPIIYRVLDHVLYISHSHEAFDLCLLDLRAARVSIPEPGGSFEMIYDVGTSFVGTSFVGTYDAGISFVGTYVVAFISPKKKNNAKKPHPRRDEANLRPPTTTMVVGGN